MLGFHLKGKAGGFVLLEILVALILTGIIVTTVYLGLFSSLDLLEAAGGVQTWDRQIRIVHSTLVREISASVPPSSLTRETFLGQNGEVDGQSSDMLTFFSYSHVRTIKDATESDLSRLSYYLENGSLIHQEWLNPFSTSPQNVEKYELAHNLTSFNVQFFNGLQWVDGWTTSQTGNLPQAVLFELVRENMAPEREQVILKIHLPQKSSSQTNLPSLLSGSEQTL